MTTIYIDRIAHLVIDQTIASDGSGYVTLGTRPAAAADELIHARHTIPLRWWKNTDAMQMRTSGHEYRHDLY